MKIKIAPGALLLLAAAVCSKGYLLPAMLLSVAVHECGHILAARAARVRLRLLELDVFGARLVCAGQIGSYRAEWLVAAAGPCASLLLFLLLFPCAHPFFRIASMLTLSLAVFNLLPIRDFDGGRMLEATLAPLLDPDTAARALSVTSFACLHFLFSLSACFLLRFGENIALAVLSVTLFVRLFLSSRP